jgi:TRAP-type mannitol/chloroaromatic compound transport system permease small subunit
MSDYLGRFFARLIPVLLILVMVVVIGRYFFGIGRVDIQELALYVHALIFLGCAGWAYSADEHVRVDIFYRNASPGYKKLVNTFGILFFLLPMIVVLGYYAIDFVAGLLVRSGNLHRARWPKNCIYSKIIYFFISSGFDYSRS